MSLSQREVDEVPTDAAPVIAETVDGGWLDGEGEATGRGVARRTSALVTAMVDGGAPHPRIYPMPDGGLQAEWIIGDREVSVAIEPGGSLYAVSVNATTGTSEDATLDDEDYDQVLLMVSDGDLDTAPRHALEERQNAHESVPPI